jgi:hypothetical protein
VSALCALFKAITLVITGGAELPSVNFANSLARGTSVEPLVWHFKLDCSNLLQVWRLELVVQVVRLLVLQVRVHGHINFHLLVVVGLILVENLRLLP